MCEKVCVTLVALRVSLLSLSPRKIHLSCNPGNGEAMAQNNSSSSNSSSSSSGSRVVVVVVEQEGKEEIKEQ